MKLKKYHLPVLTAALLISSLALAPAAWAEKKASPATEFRSSQYATTWYLAEGCTAGDFETWVLVLNPFGDPVDIEMDFMTDQGYVPGPRQTIPPDSRMSCNIGEHVTTYDISTRVTSSGGDIICERAMYGGDRTWGHDSIGVTAPSMLWYLAEGCTAGGFETWVLVQNPGENAVDIEMDFMTDQGFVPGPREAIPANSRKSYDVGEHVTTYDISTRVTSSGGDIICERAMYGGDRTWGHDSIGVNAPSMLWYLAEGCTAGGFETWVLVMNLSDKQEDIVMLFLSEGEMVVGPTETIPAHSRRSYDAGEYVTSYDVSTMVVGGKGKIICERAMYGNSRTWGHDSVGYNPMLEGPL